MKTLETYIRDEMAEGKIDFALRADKDKDGVLSFYIHPDGKDGDTKDFIVEGNVLLNKPGAG